MWAEAGIMLIGLQPNESEDTTALQSAIRYGIPLLQD